MNVIARKQNLEKALDQLICTPNMRPFLFRTRFERSMIRLVSYAEELHQEDLLHLAQSSLDRMKAIIDKSNTTSDGTLRSYTLLQDDMRRMLAYLQN